MSRPSYTQALLELGAKIDALADCVGRQEEILLAITEINGHVRDHGEAIAAGRQWQAGHQKTHAAIDGRLQTLSSRLWTLGGGGGLLGLFAMILQFLGK